MINLKAKDVGYCAGLFEGEGSIGSYPGKMTNGNMYRRLKLEISMTDEHPNGRR